MWYWKRLITCPIKYPHIRFIRYSRITITIRRIFIWSSNPSIRRFSTLLSTAIIIKDLHYHKQITSRHLMTAKINNLAHFKTIKATSHQQQVSINHYRKGFRISSMATKSVLMRMRVTHPKSILAWRKYCNQMLMITILVLMRRNLNWKSKHQYH